MSGRSSQEGSPVRGAPGPGRSRDSTARPGVAVVGDVVRNHFAVDGVVEAGADDHVDLVDGLWGQTGASPPARGRQRFVEAVEMIGPQSKHLDRAGYRDG
jgi:hypothetical protein